MREPDWLPLAQALPLGGHAKHPHYCGDGRPLVVFHGDTTWSAYCHRCGKFPPVFKPLPTLAERVAAAEREKAADQAVAVDSRPPMPAVYDMAEWPLEARVWLFKAGLSHREIANFGIYYHQPTRRVVVPVVESGSLTFWQARRIFGTGAKYLSMPGGRETTLPIYGTHGPVVLVEDLLSSFKLSTAGVCTSLCLMGTSLLSTAMAWCLRNAHRKFLVWLDPDAAGQNAAAEIKNQLAMVGIPCSIVGSLKDPKFYSRQEIADVIGHFAVTDDEGPQGLRQAGASGELALIGTTDGRDPDGLR